MSNQISNEQPKYCRRRAIWGDKPLTIEGVDYGKDETRNDAKNALLPSEEVDYGRRQSDEAVQEGADTLCSTKIGESHGEEKASEEVLVVSPYECPKCHKEYRRGMFFHKKYCKG